MRYHLFLQYGWFLQNFGKDFIRTNMHTTVIQILLYQNSDLYLGCVNTVLRLYAGGVEAKPMLGLVNTVSRLHSGKS